MQRRITRFVSPGQVFFHRLKCNHESVTVLQLVGGEALSTGSGGGNSFTDHCICVTPVVAISFAAAGEIATDSILQTTNPFKL
jgi:hypothetical protein